MSMFGDIAVECQMKKLLEFMEKNKELPPEQQIELIRREIADVIEGAKSGYL